LLAVVLCGPDTRLLKTWMEDEIKIGQSISTQQKFEPSLNTLT